MLTRFDIRPKQSWIFGAAIALFVVLTPIAYHRYTYTTYKRLCAVSEGKLYRSGCMTVTGFEDAIREFGIRTVLNLQEEAPDPTLPAGYLALSGEKESALCARLGVKYEFLVVDLKQPKSGEEPDAAAKFRELMDDKSNYPVLIHCRAGLHRTGVLVALYRMEYEGWSRQEALTELRGLGFGRDASFSPNEYIAQYIVSYQPRQAKTPGRLTSQSR